MSLIFLYFVSNFNWPAHLYLFQTSIICLVFKLLSCSFWRWLVIFTWHRLVWSTHPSLGNQSSGLEEPLVLLSTLHSVDSIMKTQNANQTVNILFWSYTIPINNKYYDQGKKYNVPNAFANEVCNHDHQKNHQRYVPFFSETEVWIKNNNYQIFTDFLDNCNILKITKLPKLLRPLASNAAIQCYNKNIRY